MHEGDEEPHEEQKKFGQMYAQFKKMQWQIGELKNFVNNQVI